MQCVPFSALNTEQWQSLECLETLSHVVPWSSAQLHVCAVNHYHAQAMLGQDNDVLAYCILTPNVDDWELLNITVAPAAKGQGIARAMLTQGLLAAFSAGAHHVFLEVRPSNVAALGLYQSMGFKTVGQRKGYYRTANPMVQEDAWVLRLSARTL
jgi:[ribosomal protein S18]-alanine N-acetyltransferase